MASGDKEQYLLKIYAAEEIELFLNGERRDIDRLLLHGLNDIVRVLIPHAAKEEEFFEKVGTEEDVTRRNAWVDAQIDKQRKKNDMMAKVATSTVSWAAIIFVGWIAVTLFNVIVDALKTAVAATSQHK